MYFPELWHQLPMSACRLHRRKYFTLANSSLKTQFHCDFYPNLGRYGLYKGFPKYSKNVFWFSARGNHAHCPVGPTCLGLYSQYLPLSGIYGLLLWITPNKRQFSQVRIAPQMWMHIVLWFLMASYRFRVHWAFSNALPPLSLTELLMLCVTSPYVAIYCYIRP